MGTEGRRGQFGDRRLGDMQGSFGRGGPGNVLYLDTGGGGLHALYIRKQGCLHLSFVCFLICKLRLRKPKISMLRGAYETRPHPSRSPAGSGRPQGLQQTRPTPSLLAPPTGELSVCFHRKRAGSVGIPPWDGKGLQETVCHLFFSECPCPRVSAEGAPQRRPAPSSVLGNAT